MSRYARHDSSPMINDPSGFSLRSKLSEKPDGELFGWYVVMSSVARHLKMK